MGEQDLFLPTSGNAAEDRSRRTDWFIQARATTAQHPADTIPYLVDYITKHNVQDALKKMKGDILEPILTASAQKSDATVADVAQTLPKIINTDDLFGVLVSYSKPAFDDDLRLGSMRVVSYIDHAYRQTVLQDAADDPLFKDAVNRALVRLGDVTAKPVDGALPAELGAWIDKLDDKANVAKIVQVGYLAIPALMAHLEEKNWRAYAVYRIIIQLPHDNLFKHMLPYTEADQLPAKRAAAVEVIGGVDHPQRMDVLRDTLQADDVGILQAALRSLKALKAEPDLVAPLAEHPERAVSNYALSALFEMGDPRGTGYAYNQATSDLASIRLKGVDNLVRVIHEKEARKHLEALKDDEDKKVQTRAQKVIQNLREHDDKDVARWAKRNS